MPSLDVKRAPAPRTFPNSLGGGGGRAWTAPVLLPLLLLATALAERTCSLLSKLPLGEALPGPEVPASDTASLH